MEQIKSFKEMTWKERFSQIWEYYRIPIFVGIAIFAVVFSLIKHFVTYQEPILNLAMVNAYIDDSKPTAIDDGIQLFLEDCQLEGEVSYNTSLYFQSDNLSGDAITALTSLDVMTSSGALDVYLSNEDGFLFLCDRGYFPDLSTVLTKEELDSLEDRLVYAKLEDGTKAPVGVRLKEDCKFLTATGAYPDGCVVGVSYAQSNPDAIEKFLTYVIWE